MEKIFEKLWYSNIFEGDATSENETKISLLAENTYEIKSQILKLVKEETAVLVKKYDALSLDLLEISEQEAFVKGFRLGAQIMLGIFKGDNLN